MIWPMRVPPIFERLLRRGGGGGIRGAPHFFQNAERKSTHYFTFRRNLEIFQLQKRTPSFRFYSSQRGNFISRLLTRRQRAWTRDDVWALFSWLFVGQGVFILVGTTTAASVFLLLANSLQFHDWLARKLTLYLAKHTGLVVSFGDLIVPNWRTGRIEFKNVSVKSIEHDEPIDYTLYDLTLGKATISLSMRRLLEGKGLVQSCDIEGVRGIVDRSKNAIAIRRDTNTDNGLDDNKKHDHTNDDYDVNKQQQQQNHHQPGDFYLEGLVLKDVLVTVISPKEFRPYKVSIISAELARLRKRFILYDFLAAESIVGMVDGSLFSMHVPQAHDRQRYETMRHLKMHALNVDFLSQGTNTTGPLSWLTKGRVDIDMFAQLPADHPSTAKGNEGILNKIGSMTEDILVEILKESGASAFFSNKNQADFIDENDPDAMALFKDQIERNDSLVWFNVDMARDFKNTTIRNWPFVRRLYTRIQKDFLNVDSRALEAPEEAAKYFLSAKPDVLSFKVDFRFHDLRAHAPWTSTVMRPLVAYINEQRPFIPLSCHFEIPKENFDGSWSLREAGIVDALSKGTTRSFELLIDDRQKKIKRLKKVSLWSLYALLKSLKTWMSESGYLLYPRMSIE